MKRAFLFVVALALAAALPAANLLIDVARPTPEQAAWLQAHALDWDPESCQVILPDSLLEQLRATGICGCVLGDVDDLSRELAGYPSPQQVADSLAALAAQYPAIPQLIDLGPTACHGYYLAGDADYASFQNEVWCLKVSDNPTEEEDEANVFFGGGIHAREAISIPVTLNLLVWLLQNYGVDDQATAWINENQSWFVPLINPDGYQVSWRQLHLYHRKNMRDNDNDGMPDYSTTDGVDLNRNFGYVWGPNGTSATPSSSIYNGPNAWSEPETRYMRDLLTARKFWGGITYHSSGEWVLYPLGHINGACSLDHAVMGALATAMAATIPRIAAGGAYTPAQAVNFGYTCQGTMGDWGYAEQRLFTFTIELANTFIPAASLIDDICDDNLQAAQMFLDRASASVVTGHVTNEDGNPLVADVAVAEIDGAAGMTPVEPLRSGELFGRYWRPLLPGSYTFTFSADGYLPQTFANVAVSDTGRTVQNVSLLSEWVPNVRIAVQNGTVTLSWPEDEGCTYVVLSSTKPDANFVEAEGMFTAPSAWRQACADEQRFYIVKRISTR